VGDLVLNSPIDAGTEEVAAYEELVGCHGGLGGWQTEAVLVHPAEWRVADPPLVGADAVHHQLVRWLEQAGQRRGHSRDHSRDESRDHGDSPAADEGELAGTGHGEPATRRSEGLT
jgi:hypothetical protein